MAELPPLAFDHHYFVEAAVERLRAKLSYTNIGFALAPREFTVSDCARWSAPRSGTTSIPPTCTG